MNVIKAKLSHNAFIIQSIQPFSFEYNNTTIRVYKKEECLMIELIGKKKENGLMKVFLKLYDLLFLMLGAYPIRLSLSYNEKEIDTSKWVIRYTTANHFIEQEAAFCDITVENINSKSLMNIDNIHKQSIASISYIVSEYYEHVVTNHRIELITHTIDGIFMHSIYYKELLDMKRLQNSKSSDTTYYENVERVFRLFFYYHRKYNCQILEELGTTKKDFYKTISDTRNDFSHLLGKKKNRLISGKDMVYYIDLIFFAERLFVLEEMLNLELNEGMIQEYMPAYKDSFDSKRLSGYGPIYYDLARYVLCDHLDRFFCINYKTREYLRETEKFIEKYKKEYDVDMLAPEGLIISIAFQYLLNQGWDEKIFWECEDKNNLGIDICIRNTYMRSTHGAKSKVMTVAEKYVWCVKHRMEAVFASQLQYNYYGQGVRYISDYYEIDDFTNTYQDYVNSRYTKIEDKWIHTDQMVKTPYKEFSAENIEKWMKKKDTPDFTVWLGEKTDARILYAYTNIVNEVLGIEEAIWISSGIVKNNDFEKLIAEVNVYSEERSELLNVAEFHSYVETCGFYTPQEVCAVQSVKEANESINIGNEKKVIQVYKLVATCLSEHIENIEKTFYLPSRIARILTGITYGDGYEYINDNNEVVCKYSDVSKGENNQQECLQINSHILASSLKENDYRMFWVFRVYRSPSSKAYELYGNDITHDTDRSYIVWFDEEKSRYIELKEIEPVIVENNNDYVLKVKYLYD